MKKATCGWSFLWTALDGVAGVPPMTVAPCGDRIFCAFAQKFFAATLNAGRDSAADYIKLGSFLILIFSDFAHGSPLSHRAQGDRKSTRLNSSHVD